MFMGMETFVRHEEGYVVIHIVLNAYVQRVKRQHSRAFQQRVDDGEVM